MSPYELLLSALGSCKAITMRMYALRKNIPLKNILINLDFERIHAEDCIDCDIKDDKIDRIDIEFTGELSSDEKNKLIEISEKCPVHKTQTPETNISTNLIAK